MTEFFFVNRFFFKLSNKWTSHPSFFLAFSIRWRCRIDVNFLIQIYYNLIRNGKNRVCAKLDAQWRHRPRVESGVWGRSEVRARLKGACRFSRPKRRCEIRVFFSQPAFCCERRSSTLEHIQRASIPPPLFSLRFPCQYRSHTDASSIDTREGNRNCTPL